MIEKRAHFKLLEESFPGMNAVIARCDTLGFSWASKPFLKEVAHEVVSHVGLFDYPLHIQGRKYNIAALHAICTKASYRGRGYATELLQKAITWAKNRYDCLVLFTEIPTFYERFSFRPLQEQRFSLSGHYPKGSLPLFPLTTPKDDALFIRCFKKRTATSRHVWVQDNGQLAAFNTLFATYPTFWSLHYCPAIDGILAFIIKDKTLHLFDIIAERIPTLDEIVAHLPSEIEQIHFYFTPDLVTTSAICRPLDCDKALADFSGYLMVHGDWPQTGPFSITPLSRC